MAPANTRSLIHNYCGAEGFADSTLKRLNIPKNFLTEGFEN